MKRLLIATTAVGLCLAAPAFAQSTTDQDQLNKQRANQPSSSAPASQAAPSSSSATGSSQSGSQTQPSSPSAQAPSSSQRGQAQNQQPSGSSSTNAQAPASSSQSSQSATTTPSKDSKKNRAQNKRQPSDSSTSARAPSSTSQSSSTSESSRSGRADNRQMQQNDRQNARASRSDRSSASLNININDQQRTRIASVIGSGNVRAVNVNFRVATGVVVPRTVALHTLPASIIEIVPEYRGYSYFVTREQIVIVEPRRKTIVAVLPAGGTARAQATSDRVTFSDQQREVIRKRASSLRSVETTGSATHYVVEEEIPATVELQEFPAEIVTEVPTVRTYRYFRQDNDVVVVDPTRRRVIEVIR